MQRVNSYLYKAANSYGISIKAGYEYNKYIAAELRYATGIKRKKIGKIGENRGQKIGVR